MLLTRQLLYAWVWSTPVLKIGEVLGMSGSAVTKICNRHRVPTPGRGHWRKVQVGQLVEPTKLPDPGDVRLTNVELPDDLVAEIERSIRAARIVDPDSSPTSISSPHSITPSGEGASASGVGSQVADATPCLAAIVDTPSNNEESGLLAGLDPSIESLRKLALESVQFGELQRTLDRLQVMANEGDLATGAVLTLWLLHVRGLLPELDPAQRIVGECRKLAAGQARPVWW